MIATERAEVNGLRTNEHIMEKGMSRRGVEGNLPDGQSCTEIAIIGKEKVDGNFQGEHNARECGVKGNKLVFDVSQLKIETRCAICMGIIKHARTVMYCLHRFCSECIESSIRKNNKECPTCRTHIQSRRALRYDPKFDDLIAALYGDVAEYELKEQEQLDQDNMMAEFHRQHMKRIEEQKAKAREMREQLDKQGKEKKRKRPLITHEGSECVARPALPRLKLNSTFNVSRRRQIIENARPEDAVKTDKIVDPQRNGSLNSRSWIPKLDKGMTDSDLGHVSIIFKPLSSQSCYRDNPTYLHTPIFTTIHHLRIYLTKKLQSVFAKHQSSNALDPANIQICVNSENEDDNYLVICEDEENVLDLFSATWRTSQYLTLYFSLQSDRRFSSKM